MSDHADAAPRTRRTGAGSPTPRRRLLAVSGVLVLGLGLASCGDDDDASDTVAGGTLVTGVETSGPEESATATTTRPASSVRPSSTAAAGASTTAAGGASTTARPSTTADAAASTTATSDAAGTTDAAADTTEASPAASSEPPATDAAATTAPDAGATSAPTESVDTSVPGTDGGSVPPGTDPPFTGPPGSVGPTTTGPACDFADNEAFPIVRCNRGPAVLVVQSGLQSLDYDVGTVDCLFGDQTLYAVRTFQSDRDLPVTGEVDEATWAALPVLGVWGDDTDGDGTIEPSELTLTCTS